MHFKIKHPCDQCDMVYTTKSNLKKHKEIRHDGLIYYGNMKQEEGGEDGEEKKEDEERCGGCATRIDLERRRMRNGDDKPADTGEGDVG